MSISLRKKILTKLIKSAQDQTLKEIIEGAAVSGENGVNGIMNFPAKLKEQKASLALNVTINSRLIGGYGVIVSNPVVNPPEFTQTYAKLPKQIENFLSKHAASFKLEPGTTDLRWDNVSINDSGIASNQ